MTREDRRAFVPLAVVGIACRLPGADGLDEYWSLLSEGRSGIVPFPPERFDVDAYYSPERGAVGTSYCRVGGVVPLRPLDPALCDVPSEFAARYDGTQLAMLETAAAALRDAGANPFDLDPARTGVYIGNSDGSDLSSKLAFHTHAGQLAVLLQNVKPFAALETEIRQRAIADISAKLRAGSPAESDCGVLEFGSNATASIITKAFGLTGPCVALDAACASSSVALLSAAHALSDGRIKRAVVGAASFRKWYELVILSYIQSLGTSDSRPFDADADGFIGSDGYASVVVKTLAQALADGGRIHGVIRAIGLSSDGRGRSFWAPRPEGQSLAITRAYEAGFDPARLQYIEAHATSTQLGDATELNSLTQALGTSLRHKLPIASVKANIGHTLETAGLASLIKTLLAMKHGIVPPAINIESPNPDVDWDNIPFFLPTASVEWPLPKDGSPRCAGIDAFGIGGLNTHTILEGPPDQAHAAAFAPDPRILEPDAESTDDEGVAVIGISCLFPGAHTLDDFRRMLRSGESAFSEIPPTRWNSEIEPPLVGSQNASLRGGFLTGWEFDWKSHKVPPKQLANANPLQFMILDAADQAFEDSGYDQREFDHTRVGTVVGAIFTGDFAVNTYLSVRLPEIRKAISTALHEQNIDAKTVESICAEYGKTLGDVKRGSLDESASFSSSTLASRITKAFDLMGGAYSVDAGDASSLAAIQSAADLLNAGTCDMVVCAAGQRSMDLVSYQRSAARGTLADGTPASPFDAAFAGTVPAEGAAVLILKRASAARRDGDRIHAVIERVDEATNCESSTQALETALEKTMESNPVSQASIQTVELNGPLASDPTAHAELLAQTVRRTPHAQLVPGSTLGQFGDLAGAAGMASLIKAVITQQEGSLLPSIVLTTEHPAWKQAGPGIRIPTTPDPIDEDADLRGLIASHNTRGFGEQGGSAWTLAICPDPKERIESLTRPTDSTVDETEPQLCILPSEGIEAVLIEAALEQTGFPEPLVHLDARFQEDFHWNHAARDAFVQDILTFLNVDESVLLDESQQPLCFSDLRALHTFLDGKAKRAASSTTSVRQSAAKGTARYILRTVARPLEGNAPAQPLFQGPVVLVGDNPVAEALSEKLGEGVIVLPGDRPVAEVLAQFDALWNQHPLPHLVLLTACDDDAAIDLGDESAFARRRLAGLTLPYHLTQRWFQQIERAGLMQEASLVAVTQLGGDFGLAGQSDAVEGGGLSGLLKGVHTETAGKLRVKSIDTAPRDPAKLVASSVLGELAASETETEVGYVRGRRQVVRAIPQSLTPARPREIAANSVWVVTGGARGITARIARAFASRFSLKLHLLGTTSENDARASLPPFLEAGVNATYHQCNVSDHTAVTATLKRVREQDGPISGIIHGAGFEHSAAFPKKSEGDVERTIDVKGDGTAALLAATSADPLTHFIAFGSTSGRFGGFNQTDYCLANELMAKMLNIARRQRTDCAYVTLHWPAWDEVGMSVRPASKMGLKLMKVPFMPVDEGVAHFIDEVTHHAHDSEVLIVDGPEGYFSRRPSMPDAQRETDYARLADSVAAAGLIDDVAFQRDDKASCRVSFDPRIDPFLTGHRVEGVPLLPAVIGIETCAQAASIASGGRIVTGIRDLKLINEFRMPAAHLYFANVEVDLHENRADCQFKGDFYDKSGRFVEPHRQYHACGVDLADAPVPIASPGFEIPAQGDWVPVPYPEDWRDMEGSGSGTVFYGPELRTLKEVLHVPEGIWGRYVASPATELGGAQRDGAWHTPSALFDGLLFSCDLYASRKFGTLQLPSRIERIRFAELPAPCESLIGWTLFRGRDGRELLFDHWLFRQDGTVLLHCENSCVVILKAPSNDAAAKT